jgi:type II secretory pathway pseudopilin PulG
MSFPRHSFRVRSGGRPGCGLRAFTLAETLLALVVLGLLVMLLFAALGRVQRQRNVARFIADLEAFGPVFQSYHQRYRAWPAASGKAGFPPELEAALDDTLWHRGSPFGGSYDGDLATGRLRTGFNGWPVYLVGDSP